MTTIDFAAELQINGWSPGCGNRGTLRHPLPFALRLDVKPGDLYNFGYLLGPDEPPAPENWRHPRVGWGLVLPDDDAVPAAAKARGEDAPEPLRALLATRGNAPVLRWSPKLGQLYLRRYYEDGTFQDILTTAPLYGTGPGQIPRYLLLYASPAQVPWAVQYAMNLSLCVGRLDLRMDEGLENYVHALMNDWAGSRSDVGAPLIWSVDHGAGDITWLMTRAVANPLALEFASDTDLAGYTQLKNADATAQNLMTALNDKRPGLVVTTSHGMTGPLDAPDTLVAQLGLLVDHNQKAVPLAAMKEWRPDGAIWYAHACCAAGSDHSSRYADIIDRGSDVGRILNGVAQAAGARIAPMPRALLGHKVPLRAFIGHVEPTFDWTLRQPQTHQVLTDALVSALYDNLYRQGVATPVGWAFREIYKQSGAFYGSHQEAQLQANEAMPGAAGRALFRKLVAMDLQTLVVLGDPTVTLPRL